jgi:hypothetical protein
VVWPLLAWEVIIIAQSEREREEEVIRHSRKVAGGATMGIWF